MNAVYSATIKTPNTQLYCETGIITGTERNPRNSPTADRHTQFNLLAEGKQYYFYSLFPKHSRNIRYRTYSFSNNNSEYVDFVIVIRMDKERGILLYCMKNNTQRWQRLCALLYYPYNHGFKKITNLLTSIIT